NGNCTLGEAVQAASSNVAVDGCAAGSRFAFDIIDVPTGIYTLSAPNNTGTNGANGLPVISGTTIINGNGATITRSGSQFRFFEVSVDGNLTLNNLTFSNGSATGSTDGGAIYSVSSPITVNGGTFINNVAVNGSGGAIKGSTITLTNSTFISNSSKGHGG